MTRRLDREHALVAGGLLAAGLALVLLEPLSLWLVNGEGPMADHQGWARLVVLGGALGGAVVLLGLAYAAGRLHLLVLAALVVALVAAGVVLFPTRTDVSESFLPQPNPRSSCSGWSFSHYPPGTMDASSVRYCVGVERPLPPG